VPAIYEKPKFDSWLQVWDLARNRLVRLIHSPAGGLSSAAFSTDGETLVTQGGPRTTGRFGTEVVLWDTRTWRPRGAPLLVNPEYSGDRTVAVSADAKLLAVPRSSGAVQVWSSSARKPVNTLPPTRAALTNLAFARDGSTLGTFSAPARSDAKGLSFLGVSFTDAIIARVRITLGTGALGAGVSDVSAGGTVDLVVLDNVIYGEPRKAF
jgi:WD40 repeat protein